jgi:hypothetical protein
MAANFGDVRIGTFHPRVIGCSGCQSLEGGSDQVPPFHGALEGKRFVTLTFLQKHTDNENKMDTLTL